MILVPVMLLLCTVSILADRPPIDDRIEELQNTIRRTKQLRAVIDKLRIFIMCRQNFTITDCSTDPPVDVSVIPIDRKLSDYIEMGVYILLTVFGGGINVYVGRKLWAQYRKRTVVQHIFDLKTAFLLLKLNLTFANLLILFVVCPSKFGWLVTYAWVGGDTLCKVGNYVFMVAVDMPCYIITCIAVDRCRVVYRMSMAQRSNGNMGLIQENPMRWTRVLLTLAYTFALVPSTMQFFIWSVVTPEPEHYPDWQQCTTLWHGAYYRGELTRDEVMTHRFYGIRMIDYQMWHLCMTFWVPFFLIVLCYGYITYVLFMYTCKPYTKIPLGVTKENTTCNGAADGIQMTPPISQQQTTVVIVNDDYVTKEKDVDEGISLTIADEKDTLEIADNGASLSPSMLSLRSCTSRKSMGGLPSSRSHQSGFGTGHNKPLWQNQLRSKTFNTSGLIVLCYLAFWLPYAVIALVAMHDPVVASFVDDNLYVVQSLIHFNTVVNPFLYGFSDHD